VVLLGQLVLRPAVFTTVVNGLQTVLAALLDRLPPLLKAFGVVPDVLVGYFGFRQLAVAKGL
jgi:hypothetical protein